MQTVATSDSTAFANDVVTRIADHYGHILLPVGVSHAVLDGIATGLAALHGRVLRPSTSNALTLPGLLAQIAGVPDAALDELELECACELLTAGPDCDWVVLMLDRADTLDAAALRYLQMTIKVTPLRLLCVDGAAFNELLNREEFRVLRRDFIYYSVPVEANTIYMVSSGALAGHVADTELLRSVLPVLY